MGGMQRSAGDGGLVRLALLCCLFRRLPQLRRVFTRDGYGRMNVTSHPCGIYAARQSKASSSYQVKCGDDGELRHDSVRLLLSELLFLHAAYIPRDRHVVVLQLRL